MTSLVNLGKGDVGRLALAGWAWYNFGKSVIERDIVGTATWGTVSFERTIAVFYPDPVALAIEYSILRAVGGVVAVFNFGIRVFTWMASNPAKANLIVFTALLPFAIKERQVMKAEKGLIEPIGRMSFDAESMPDSERLQVPQAINPMTGSRVL